MDAGLVTQLLSSATSNLLGELTILDRILEAPLMTQRYTSHLAVDHQARVRLDLENLRNAKRSRLEQVLSQAYGLAKPQEGDLGPGLSVENHLVLLKPAGRVSAGQPSALSNVLDTYLPALLEARYPRHPHFGKRSAKARRGAAHYFWSAGGQRRQTAPGGSRAA